MDLWSALGISRETGLFAALGGFAIAVLMAGVLLWRRSRQSDRIGVRLTEDD